MSIVGLGLMGGSLALALRSSGASPRLSGWDASEEARASALASGAFDDVPADRAEALEGADLVVLAMPLGAGLAALEAIAAEAPAAATLTDVISLKRPVVEAVARLGLSGRWVGSHPMTGSEASGFAAARVDLYRGSVVWTVGDARADARRAAVDRFWETLGARPLAIGADEHDRLMAWVSHLPQLASTALATVLSREGIEAAGLGPGGRDATRLAGSSPEMWAELLAGAPAELVDGLRALSGEVARLADLAEAGEAGRIADAMRLTRRWRGGA